VIFERLKEGAEKVGDATVTSAAPLSAEQQGSYASALRQRLKTDVRLHCEVDPSLLGGAILRADDLVIDGSLRGRLDRLATELLN
jgi:F-type H+-transporting ATPase subunit delta